MKNENYFHLKDVIDIDVLQEIQDKLSEITGAALVTVDFKGTPVTKYSNFSDFCKKIRKDPEKKRLCYKSDAYAGLEAAISQKSYIYRCPAGLVDFSAPIIVGGQYLGSVTCGQVRTNNNKLIKINKVEDYSKDLKADKEFVEVYKNTAYIEYSKIEAIASLIYIVVNQIAEKSMINLVQKELNNKNMKLMESQKARIQLEKELKIAELKALQSQVNPHFLFNVLNSIGSLALIENAKKTQEMTYSFAELLRYTIKNVNNEVALREDVENLSRYLKIQSIRFGDRIKYKINIDDNIKNVKILSMILQPFVENAIKHGIQPKEDGGVINIRAYGKEKYVVIIIKDDGVGIPKSKLFNILNNDEEYKNDSIGIGIINTNDRLINYYGKEYKIQIDSEINVGTVVKIKIPIG